MLTVASHPADFSAWHGGRRYALAWALDLDLPDLREAMSAARARLNGLLAPNYRRQPHVTIGFAGLLGEPGRPAYGHVELTRDLASLRAVIEGPVRLRATAWDTFSTAPYLRIDHDWLTRAHDALPGHLVDAPPDYTPHVTVGLYGVEMACSEAVAKLQGPVPSASWRVTELSLMRYQTAELAGPLATEGRLDLTTGQWVWDFDSRLRGMRG